MPENYPSGHVRTATQYSAGAVVYRSIDGGFEVLLTVPSGRNVWCLPKGLLDDGEKPEDAAIREVREETGAEGDLGQELGRISYWYLWKEDHTLYKKTVTFFLMRYVSGDIRGHDQEVRKVEWVPIDVAADRLSYRSEKDILAKARQVLLSGSP